MVIIKNTSYNPIVQGMSGTAAAQTINGILHYEYGVERYEFTNSDITEGILTYAHNKGTLNVYPVLYDADRRYQQIDGLFRLIDENSWELSMPISITGTYFLTVDYKP